MSRFLRLFAFLFVVFAAAPAFAAGYSCPAYMKYTSCNAGYYMTKGGSYNATPQAGNTCTACPSGYTCAGGTANAVPAARSCSAGTYWNGSACASCGGNAYYCPGFSNVTNPSSGYGRNGVSSGYYSTGGGTTTRTGQAACGGNAYYCSGGARYGVSSGYYSTGGGTTTRTGQAACGGNAYYCSGGARYGVSSGYYSTGGGTTTRTGQAQCTGTNYCSGGALYACPSGYTANTGAGKTAASQCQISVAAGKYLATVNTTTTGTCAAGTSKAAHNVNYGSTSACGACTGATYSGAGAGACSACPSGYTANTASNKTAASQCQITTAAGKYIASAHTATATTCPAGYYCPAATINYGNTGSVGSCTGATYSGAGAGSCSACPSGYTANTASNKTAASQCQISVAAGKYLSTVNTATTGSCAAGTYKAAHNVNYGSTSACSACTGATYSGVGVGACLACPSGYTANTASNKTAASQCQISVAAGKYISTVHTATTASCAAGTYKAAHTVNYGSSDSCAACAGRTQYSGAGAAACSTVSTGYYTTGCSGSNNCTGQAICTGTTYCTGGVANQCPSAATYKRTTFPAHYYSPTIDSTALQSGSGLSSASGCQVLSWLISPTRGKLYEYANYNASSGKYDSTSSYGWHEVNSGYYLTDKAGCGSYAYYLSAKDCPAGSYCPGKQTVACSASNQATVHTTNFGLETCPGVYSKSSANSKSAAYCYLTTAATKYVASAGAGEASCAAGNACPGGTNVYYTAGIGATTGGIAACTGATYSGAGAGSCTACPSGYTANTASNKTAATQCQISVAAGKYMATGGVTSCAAGTSKAAHTVNYGSTSSCAACGVGTYSAAGAGSCTACSGATQYQDATAQSSCKNVSSGYYKSSNSAQTQCPASYRNGAGAANQNSCIGSFTKTGSQLAPATPGNCASVTATGTCTPGTCTYQQNYAGTITSNCTPTNCTKPITGVTANANYYANASSCSACPSGYPASDAGNSGGITKCYSGTKSRAWSGGQTACAKPSNCATVSCNACSIGACNYVAYSNTAGTGDGTIKSGCSSNSASCQQSVKSVTANANYYANGTSCSACPSGYPNSSAGAAAITQCYSNTRSRAWSGSQTACAKPANCATVSCNTCSIGACNYDVYSNSAGTGDGTIKSGCSSNSASCQQTIKSVTANAGAYTSGTSCAMCPDGYRSGGGTTAITGCITSVGAGQYIGTANTSTATACAAGTYKGAHNVNYGAVSACAACGAGTFAVSGSASCTSCAIGSYSAAAAGGCTACQNGSTTSAAGQSSCNATCSNKDAYATNWTAASWSNNTTSNTCVLSGCSGGYYVVSNACTSVGAGYWSASGSGTRSVCATGLTTIGFGTGADEAADCGRILNIGSDKLYLRSAKKTTPSLNVGINGTTYYGNMDTSTKGKLRINSGGTQYSVFDDSM